MSENSKIEWTDATWNPVLGCDKISPGCKNCYAIRTAWRLQHNPNPKVAKAFEGLTVMQGGQPNWTGRVNFIPERLTEPLRWKQPRRIFVNSQSDLFHDSLPFELIDRVFAVMAIAQQHTFQVLTKRPMRMYQYLTNRALKADYWKRAVPTGWALEWNGVSLVQFPLPNVWLGVSCENQAAADERIPLLLSTPAAVRWISAEPLLGPIELRLNDFCPEPNHDKRISEMLHWIVTGGESGPNARPMHPDWVRNLRDQCKAAGVPFFFKQWGEWEPSGYSGGKFDPAQAGQLIAGTVACSTSRSDIGKTVYHAMPLKADDGKNTATWRVMNKVGKKAAGRKLDGVEHNEYPAGAQGEKR